MKNILQKTILLSTIAILLLVSIVPNQASMIKKGVVSSQNLTENENVLADISVTWDSFFHRYSLKDLGPNITINQSAITDFYFPEINGSIPKMNFSVVCKHKLVSKVIFPRFTQVYMAMKYNGTYILLNQSSYHRCKNLEWEYINLTIQTNDAFIPLETQGQNITLEVEVGAFFFILGSIQQLTPITIHPVPQ